MIRKIKNFQSKIQIYLKGLFKSRRVKYAYGYRLKRQHVLRLIAGLFVLSTLISLFNFRFASAAITQDQVSVNTCAASGGGVATCTATITSATANDLLIAVCTVNANALQTLAVSGFSTAVGQIDNGFLSQAIFYKVAAGGETSVSCTMTGSGNKRGAITVFEYSGMATASVVDQTDSDIGSGLSPTSGTTSTTTNANDLIIAGIGVNAARTFSTWTNSFGEQSDHSNSSVAQGTADNIVSSTGAYSTGATLSGTGSPAWVGQVVAFKDAGNAAGSNAFSKITQEGYVFENDDVTGGSAGVSLEQSDTEQCAVVGTTCTASATISAATNNNLLIAVCTVLGQSETPTISVSGYTLAVGPTSTSTLSQSIYYKVSTGGETSVGCTASQVGSANIRAFTSAFEYSGMATSGLVDQTATNSGTGSSVTTGTTATTTNASDLLIAGFGTFSANTFSTWTNSFNEQTDHNVAGVGGMAQATADRIVSATGAYSAGATSSGSDSWVGQIVAFKAASGGGGSIEDGSQLAGSEFSSGKTLSAVRIGERINLRMQITNSGDGAFGTETNAALFYDRGDGIWNRVEAAQPANTASGSCSDSDFDCAKLDSTDDVGEHAVVAVNPATNQPWAAYKENTGSDLHVAQYVGTGGNGCDNSAWTCEEVETTLDAGNEIDLAFEPDGTAWVSYIEATNDDVVVAQYVGTSGTGCDSTAWTCTTVAATNVLNYSSIAIDQEGSPWVAFWDDSGDDLVVAKYVTSGGDCDSTYGGSDAWECTVIESTGTVNGFVGIAIDGPGNPRVSYKEGTDLYHAQYVGISGTGCDSTAWTCTAVWVTGDVGDDTSIATAPDGNPWIAHRDSSSSDLLVANYVGTGGNCDLSYGGSDAWQCTEVDTAEAVESETEIVFAPDGSAWVSYYDGSTDDNVRLARYIGSGGNGCALSAWSCSTVLTTDDVGADNSLAFDANGTAWLAFDNVTDGDLEIANLVRRGEILIAPSVNYENWASISESHSDMTSASDTTSRDDADCLAGSTTWNTGLLAETEQLSRLTLPAGDSTKQCTELMWILDTSQASPSTTYRFILATDDNFDIGKGPWRGPISVATDGYPTLTSRDSSSSSYRYSKDKLEILANCDNTAWGCDAITSGGGALGAQSDIARAPDGTLWAATYDSSSSDLIIAHYVGANGTGCGSSDTWDCTTIVSTAAAGQYTDIEVAPDGTLWIAYNGDGVDLSVAYYVGSGGTGCDNAAWSCVEVDESSASIGVGNALEIDQAGNVWIAYIDGTNSDLKIATRVKAGTGTGCSGNGWMCEKIEDVINLANRNPGFAIDDNGKKWISYIEEGTEDDMWVAEYVGSGGTGCTNAAWICTEIESATGPQTDMTLNSADQPVIAYEGVSGGVNLAERTGSGSNCDVAAWNCTTVISGVAADSQVSLAMDGDGNPWIAYHDQTGDDLEVARYVGGSGGSGCTSSAWTCNDVDTSSNAAEYPAIAFDGSAIPVIVYQAASTELGVAKMHLPPGGLSYQNTTEFNSKDAGTGDLRNLLYSGLSPYNDNYTSCGGNTDLLGYCGLYQPDLQLDSATASIGFRPVYGFSTKYESNSQLPSATVYFQSNISPASQNVILQAYRYGTTNAWETISTYSSAGCTSGNCTIVSEPSGTASEYFMADGSDYWIHYRLYQIESASAVTTLYVDGFTATQTLSKLRHGRVFRENLNDPFRW